VQLLGGLGLAGVFGPTPARAEQKCARAGQKTSKKRKTCCAGLVKDGSVCRPCTVICPEGATDCGAALETTMAGGGTVYVCPGTYQTPSGSFLVGKSVTVVGAGDGNDPARDTILHGTGAQGVMRIQATTVVNATFRNLRITGGGGGPGGGVYNGPGHILSLIGCTITGNTAEGTSGADGGIFNSEGARLSLTDCTVSDNSGENTGGGIKNFSGRVSLKKARSLATPRSGPPAAASTQMAAR
jgi:hypothetical protein